MATYTVSLKHRREVAEGTTAFLFEKPDGLSFKAGQYLNFTLLDPPETDAEGNTRTFSIASAPDEEELMMATRMRDTAFKRVLKTMPLGAQVEIEGPYGNFTLHKNAARPAVFLTGGIGITPYRSIIRDAGRKKLPHRLFLFYSNRRPEDGAFLEELQQAERDNPNYQFVGTMTDMANSKRPWQGKTGYINRDMLAQSISDLTTPIYYIAGPPGMVTAMRKMLADADINDDSIRTEEFNGY
jgi:ferredoxin-NADP reductase